MKEEHDNSLTDQQQKTQDNLRHRLHQKAQQGKGAAPKDTSLSLSELTNALNSIDTERILQQVPLKKSPTERWAKDRKGSADEEERSSYLLSQHVKHHSQLVDNLEQQMTERRSKLQQRLKAIQDAKASDASAGRAGATHGSLETQQNDEIERLQNLQKVVSPLCSAFDLFVLHSDTMTS